MEKLRRHDEQETNLYGRRNYSKTDKDATSMRLKNGELVPGYMVIMGTEYQFILNISIHQKPSEADNFIEHIDGFLQNGFKPKRVIGDST